jgi:hypothetical protein
MHVVPFLIAQCAGLHCLQSANAVLALQHAVLALQQAQLNVALEPTQAAGGTRGRGRGKGCVCGSVM